MIEEEEERLEREDQNDLLTNDNTDGQCETGDWRRCKGNEEHCDLFDGENGDCCDK
jgi:hypothetical protein